MNRRITFSDPGFSIGGFFADAYDASFTITPQMINNVYRGIVPGENSKFTFLRTFMDSELDCDKMDYLLRDSTYCGVSYGRYDLERLLSCLTIFTKDKSKNPSLGIESGGVQAFEEFVLARYFMFVQVYFHRTRRTFDNFLVDAIREILPTQEADAISQTEAHNCFPTDVNEYLKWDDIKVMSRLRERAEEGTASIAVKAIIDRIPWTCIYFTKIHPVGDGLELFEDKIDALISEFGEDSFGKLFTTDKSDKLPHKIIPRKHTVDEEEVIAIINEKTGRISTISDESHIINSLTEKINIHRIYADPSIAERANQIVNKQRRAK